MHSGVRLWRLAGVVALLGSAGCDYVRLLRPSVLKQLNPRVVRFVNELPELDEPNKEIVARLAGSTGLDHATVGADGRMHATLHVPLGQFVWSPSVLVLPHAGTIDIDVQNADENPHALMIASNGERVMLDVAPHSAGRASVTLGQPGLYTFACPVANHGGRGMLGFVIVTGNAEEAARLDRPSQPRP